MSEKLSNRYQVLQFFAKNQGRDVENPEVYAALGAADQCQIGAIHKCMSRLVNEGNLVMVCNGTRTITDAGIVAAKAQPRAAKQTKEQLLEKQRIRDRAKREAKLAAIAESVAAKPKAPEVPLTDPNVEKWVSKEVTRQRSVFVERVVPDVCSTEVRERIGYINTMFPPRPVVQAIGGRV